MNSDQTTESSLTNSRDVETVRKQPQLDGKRQSQTSNGTFLFTAIVGVPVWLTVVLPLTIAYQTGKKIFTVSSAESGSSETNISETESFPSPEELTPVSERKYDAVILGATGFTGRLAAFYLANNYSSDGKQITWAIAGRNKDKLNKIKQDIQNSSPSLTSLSIDTLVVDTSKPSTLHNLVKDAKTVITTAGPFVKYGSNVVEFCARYGTNYADITGETGWNKEMMMKWDAIAQQTGAKIVSLCACDSIPWDLTYFKLSQLLREECKDTIQKVECFDVIKGAPSGGTVATVLTAIEGDNAAPRFEYDPYYRKRDGSRSKNKIKDESPLTIQKKNEYDGDARHTTPWFLGAVNADVVKRTHALDDHANGQELTYDERWVHPSFQGAFVTWFGTIFGATALMNPITGTPFKKFLLPKPGEGPTQKQMDHGYLLVSGVGEGVNGSKVESEFYFPQDPGYPETARMVCEAGLCLALDGDKLPVQGGGFYSPAVAMGDVLLERLCKTGSKFASRVVHVQDGKLLSKL